MSFKRKQIDKKKLKNSLEKQFFIWKCK